MSESDSRARERLLKLLSLRLGYDIEHDDFRSEFETTFNFDLARESVSEEEFLIFQRLFEKIVWYSPFSDERESIPNYIGEQEMEAAIAEARVALGITAR